MPSRSLASRKKLLLLFVRWGSIGSMAYQFNHIESYGRTAGKGKQGGHSLTSIINEVERIDGNCNHVENPKAPILLDGVMPHDAQKMAEKWAETVTDSRGHKLRKDALCMIGGVISFPNDYEKWDEYKKDAIKWLKTEFGEGLKSVVEHTDEGHRHFHFYVVPKDGERFESIHKGLKAGNAVDPKRGKRDRDKVEAGNMRQKARNAYKSEMGLYQDRFYDEVSKKYGLLRLGPKKRRLPRSEYQAEKREALLQAKIAQENEVKTDALNKRESILNAREEILEKNNDSFDSTYAKFLDEKADFDEKKGLFDKQLLDLELRERKVLSDAENVKIALKMQDPKYVKNDFFKDFNLAKYFKGLDQAVVDMLDAKFIELSDSERAKKLQKQPRNIQTTTLSKTPPLDKKEGLTM